MDTNKAAGSNKTLEINNKFSDVFIGIGSFKVTFSMMVKDNTKPYKHHQDVWKMHHKDHLKELKRLQEQEILGPLEVNETTKWCNGFIIIPKANGTLHLCLNPVKLNQGLIRPIHRGSTLNYMLHKLTNTCYITMIDAG